jgi:hypothetical protein
LTVNLLGLFVLSVAINAGPLLIPARDTPELARLVKGINDVAGAVIVIITLVTMIQIVFNVIRLVRSRSD